MCGWIIWTATSYVLAVARGVSIKNAASVLAEGFATGDLRAFQIGCGASALGLWGFTVALAVAAYQDGGTTAVAVAVLIRTLPAACVAPITAWLGDLRSRRGAVAVGAAASLALLAALALVVGAHGLLHDVARTADVSAHGDCRLLTLAGDVFLMAVTGHARSRRTAHAVAEARASDPSGVS